MVYLKESFSWRPNPWTMTDHTASSFDLKSFKAHENKMFIWSPCTQRGLCLSTRFVQCLQRTAWHSMSLQRLRWWKTPTSFALTGCSPSVYRLIRPSSPHRHTWVLIHGPSLGTLPWHGLSRLLQSWINLNHSSQGQQLQLRREHSRPCSLNSQALRLSSGGQQGPFWLFVVFPHSSTPDSRAGVVNVGIPGWRSWQQGPVLNQRISLHDKNKQLWERPEPGCLGSCVSVLGRMKGSVEWLVSFFFFFCLQNKYTKYKIKWFRYYFDET